MSAEPSRLSHGIGFLLLGALVLGCIKPTPVERAMSLARQHREREGITVLRAEIASHPSDVDARRLLIRLLAVSGDLGAARDEVGALARELPPGDPTPWIELGHALELVHQFDDAMAAYETAAEKAPASPEGPRQAGERAARWGQWEDAEKWLDEAVKRGGRTADVWHTLGLVRLNLHDTKGAREAYEAGTRVDPKGVDSWLGLATIALVTHDWKAALVAYDEVLVRRPGWGDGELGRAWALAQLGRKDEAERALDRAVEMGANAGAVAKQRARLARVVDGDGPR